MVKFWLLSLYGDVSVPIDVSEVIVPPVRARRRPPASSSNAGPIGMLVALGSIVLVVVFVLGSLGVINMPVISAQAKADKVPSVNSQALQILAEAEKHDNEAYVYGGGHPPKGYHNGDGLDCSGLIDVAVLRVAGVNENNTARDFRNSKHWKSLKSLRDAQKGDVMYLLKEKHPGHSDDHIAIVVSNGGDGKLTVFEAYGTGGGSIPFRDQIRTSVNQPYSRFDGALRWKG